MNRSETALALGMAAAIDRRTVGEADVAAWHATLGDLGLDEVQAAIAEHYRGSRDWLMPADIRAAVSTARRARVVAVIGNEPVPAPPPELDDDPRAGVRWQQACIAALATGRATDLPAAMAQADRALDVVRQPEALRSRPTAAIAAQVAQALRMPGTRERDDDREATA